MSTVVGFDEYNDIKKAFDEATSKIDLAQRLGIPTNISGAKMNKLLQKYADKIGGFNLRSLVKGTEEYKERFYYKNNPKTCKNCGKIIPYERKDNNFCSQSCATKYNNAQREPKSKEEKEKISTSLLKYHGWSDEEIEKIKSGELKITRKKISKVCPVCHKEFKGTPKQIYCSKECVHNSPEYREKLRQSQFDLVKNGTHKGWQIRPLNSYAEKFWMDVLDENNIGYIREDHTNQKYFLDFLIEKDGIFIDLEIDGRQHTHPDRIEHDKERDEFITNELGYIVYRVPWNEVNSDNGKVKMKEKIDKFLEFYNSL